jgi:SPP1 gp7 family putative phage head morphogenesis protein
MSVDEFRFWASEEEEFWSTVEDLIIESVAAGVVGGIHFLTDDQKEQIDLEDVEQRTMDLLTRFRLDTFAEISITTMLWAIEVIQEWRASGEDLNALEEKLRKRVFSRTRAEAIAISEVTRLFAAGNEIVWGATGLIFGKVWQTSQDELVCPICAPLHGQLRFIGADFDIGIQNPPAHPRCRCWIRPATEEALVVSQIIG